jgi:hypothetical protein
MQRELDHLIGVIISTIDALAQERAPDVVAGALASPFLSFPVIAVDDRANWSALLHVSMGSAVVVGEQKTITMRASLAGNTGLPRTHSHPTPPQHSSTMLPPVFAPY